jgi:hypothetical protein
MPDISEIFKLFWAFLVGTSGGALRLVRERLLPTNGLWREAKSLFKSVVEIGKIFETTLNRTDRHRLIGSEQEIQRHILGRLVQQPGFALTI